jgi:SNF family Na+-dependent transporter
VRAYLIAFGLTALVIGLPLLLSGEVGIGCTVTNHGGTTTYSDCAGAHSLIVAGEIGVVAAVVLFIAAVIPSNRSQSK